MSKAKKRQSKKKTGTSSKGQQQALVQSKPVAPSEIEQQEMAEILADQAKLHETADRQNFNQHTILNQRLCEIVHNLIAGGETNEDIRQAIAKARTIQMHAFNMLNIMDVIMANGMLAERLHDISIRIEKNECTYDQIIHELQEIGSRELEKLDALAAQYEEKYKPSYEESLANYLIDHKGEAAPEKLTEAHDAQHNFPRVIREMKYSTTFIVTEQAKSRGMYAYRLANRALIAPTHSQQERTENLNKSALQFGIAEEEFKKVLSWEHLPLQRRVEFMGQLSLTYAFRGQDDKAEKVNEEIRELRLNTHQEHKHHFCQFYVARATGFILQQKWNRALKEYEHAITLAEEVNDPGQLTWGYIGQGEVYRLQYEQNKEPLKSAFAKEQHSALLDKAYDRFAIALEKMTEHSLHFRNSYIPGDAANHYTVLYEGLETIATLYSTTKQFDKLIEARGTIGKYLHMVNDDWQQPRFNGQETAKLLSRNAAMIGIAEKLLESQKQQAEKEAEAKRLEAEAVERSREEYARNIDKLIAQFEKEEKTERAALKKAAKGAQKQQQQRIKNLTKKSAAPDKKENPVAVEEEKKPHAVKSKKEPKKALSTQRALHEDGMELLVSDLITSEGKQREAFNLARSHNDYWTMAFASWGLAEIASTRASKALSKNDIGDETVAQFEKTLAYINDALDNARHHAITHEDQKDAIADFQLAMGIMADGTKKLLDKTIALQEKQIRKKEEHYKQMFSDRENAMFRMGLHSLKKDPRNNELVEKYHKNTLSNVEYDRIMTHGMQLWRTNPAPKGQHAVERITLGNELAFLDAKRHHMQRISEGYAYITSCKKTDITHYNPYALQEIVPTINGVKNQPTLLTASEVEAKFIHDAQSAASSNHQNVDENGVVLIKEKHEPAAPPIDFQTTASANSVNVHSIVEFPPLPTPTITPPVTVVAEPKPSSIIEPNLHTDLEVAEVEEAKIDIEHKPEAKDKAMSDLSNGVKETEDKDNDKETSSSLSDYWAGLESLKERSWADIMEEEDEKERQEAQKKQPKKTSDESEYKHAKKDVHTSSEQSKAQHQNRHYRSKHTPKYTNGDSHAANLGEQHASKKHVDVVKRQNGPGNQKGNRTAFF